MTQMNWSQQALGTNLSEIVMKDDIQDGSIRSHERGPNLPPNPTPGMFWICTTQATNESAGAPTGTTEALLRRTASGTWVFVARFDSATGGHGLVARNGAVPMTGSLAMGNNSVTGLRAAAANGEAVRFEQTIVKTTSGTIHFNAGDLTIRSTATPEHPDDLVRLQDVASAAYPASLYWNTNRNLLGGGNAYGAVKLQQQGVATDYTKMPYTPRRLTVRLFGTAKEQGGGPVFTPTESFNGKAFVLYRWNADGTGGDPGTSVGAAVKVADMTAGAPLWLVAEWKYPGAPSGNTDAGAWLRLIQATNEANALAGVGDWHDLVNTSNTGINGTVQVFAEYGVGT